MWEIGLLNTPPPPPQELKEKAKERYDKIKENLVRKVKRKMIVEEKYSEENNVTTKMI